MRLLLSLFTAATLATTLGASPPFSLVPLDTVNQAGCASAMTGTATYALNQAITGTTSAAIDLGLVGCFSFTVTTTAGGQPIRVWQSNSSTTYTAGTTVSAGTIVAQAMAGGTNAQACYSFTKLGGRYVWFDIPGLSPNLSGPNYITPTASRYSVWYYTPTGGTVGAGGSNVTANQGAPNAAGPAWYVQDTATTSASYWAKNTVALHANTEDFLGSMSPTATDAFKYLTPSALTTVTISNIGTGAGTVWMAFSNTSAAVNPTNIGIACAPGICVFANPAGTFLHYANSNVLTITAAVHDWLTPALSGTTLQQTPPFN